MAYNLSNEVYSGDGRGESPRSGPELDDHNESGNLSDKPVYLLEHLATFTVNEESGILYPSDGMRKLLQLEKTTGIWSQKMQLCLDRQWVLIMDYETGNIIERFPATLIQEPTAFTSNDPMEMYNNILVFIVGGESSRSEMHIFQCQGISAIHLVEDLKALRSGKMVAKYWDPLPQQQNKEKEPSASKLAINRGPPQISAADYYHQQDTDSDLGGLNDDTSSTSSEKYERDVTVLNHCFDDIEKFIARLQHAAAASRELERRRRSRRSKKKDPGEGLLTLRTRPPHEKEFIDIFAKFKLSFNLLAKLKAHIHDPNAPELVHFLFTPLALIVDASHDTYYDPNLPARVIKPLLTREAINLLINCVTSKETELWRSLGDAWTIPRDQWKGNVAPYHPVFFDGWSPDYPVVDDLEMSSLQLKGGRRSVNASGGQSSDYNVDYDFESAPAITTTGVMNVPPPGSPVIRDFSTRSEISIDSIERNGGPSATVITSAMVANASGERERDREMGRNVAIASNSSDLGNDSWLEELKARNAKIVQVTYPRTANNDKELTVVRGEFLEVMDDTRKWWKARNSRGMVAHVPHTIVTQYPYTDTASNPNSGNDILYNQQAPPQNYNKNRVSSEENPHNVMPADWVRNKHLAGHENAKEAQVKAGAFSYSSNKSDRSSYDGDAWYLQQQQQQQITSTNFMVAAANQSANRNSKYSHNMNDENNNNNINNNSNHINNVQKHINKPPPPPPLPASNSSTLKSVKSVNLNTLTRNDKNNNNNNNNISNGTASNQSTITRQSSTNSFSQKQNQQVGDMQEELKQVLTLFKERRRNLDIIKTPEIFITQDSTPSEVEQWLVGKQFSESIVKKMKGLNGNELLALSKNTFEEYCGVDEGRRLASQITLQKANNKYNTARSSELQAILARARLKTEQSA